MDAGDKFFLEIIQTLQREDILSEFILIGGWCQKLYRRHFNNPPELSALRTADIDFLIRNAAKIGKSVDINKILSKLGFDEIFSNPGGYNKYVHPDLEIEFLVPAVGRPKDKPFPLKQLNTNAQRLRYLEMLITYSMEINFYGIKVFVPQPAAFVINKFITSQRRNDKSKKTKDLTSACEVGEYISQFEDQKIMLQKIFNNLNPRSQKKLIDLIKKKSETIYGILSA